MEGEEVVTKWKFHDKSCDDRGSGYYIYKCESELVMVQPRQAGGALAERYWVYYDNYKKLQECETELYKACKGDMTSIRKAINSGFKGWE